MSNRLRIHLQFGIDYGPTPSAAVSAGWDSSGGDDHGCHRTERVLREAQRQWGVPEREALFWSGLLPSGDDTRDTATTCATSRGRCGR